MRASEILKDYEILEENRIQDTFIQYLVHHKRNKNLKFFINRETVERSGDTLQRIEALIKSKEINVTIATEIFVEQVNSLLLVYTIVPFPKQSQLFLRSLLNSDSLSSSQKLRIFQNLSNSVYSLHELGVPHLELCPDSILIENKSVVYLTPFKIVPDVYSEDFYYSSPEVLSGIPYFLTQFGGDIWSLGCIYAELFISLTPLFQAPSPQEKLLKMFEVLGTPNFQELEDYLTWENYKEIKSLAKQNTDPIKHMIFSNLTGKEKEIVLSMLSFSIEKRIDIQGVVAFPWEDEESYTIQPDPEIINKDFEFPEHTKIDSGHTSFKLYSKEEKSFEVKKIEPKPVFNFLEIKPNNTLYISIQSAINLNLFKYCSEEYFLSFSFDLDISNVIQSSSVGPFKAGSSLQINYKKEFLINSEDFKKKYRTNPLIIKVTQSLINGEKKREDLLGVCEAYLGLLFSSAYSQNALDSSVNGWYHITSGKGIIGQLQIEIKTKTPICQIETMTKSSCLDESFNNERSLIKGIVQDLGNLTAQLRERDDCKVKREQEYELFRENDFAETLKQLRKLLLDKP